MIGFIIGAVFFAVVIAVYAFSSSEERDRYYELERKRRSGGKSLPPAELEEWKQLAKKFKW